MQPRASYCRLFYSNVQEEWTMSDLDETDFMSAASVAVSAAQALEDEIVGEEG